MPTNVAVFNLTTTVLIMLTPVFHAPVNGGPVSFDSFRGPISRPAFFFQKDIGQFYDISSTLACPSCSQRNLDSISFRVRTVVARS